VTGMQSFSWLTTIGLVPLVGAVVLMLLPAAKTELAKRLALFFSAVPLLLVIGMAFQFDADSTAEFQFVESYSWIPTFGISYQVGVDGISLILIALSAILVPLVILAGWNDADDSIGSVKGYFALFLVLETFMIGVFAATDVFLFYVFFEAMLIPVYFLIGRYGGPGRQYAAVKFLIYSLVGGLLMLVALIGLYVASANELGQGTFDFTTLTNLNIDPGTQKLLFLGFFIAFAIKAPLFPFHTWLPDAASASTPGTAVLLVGVLDKVGTFGMLKLCLPIFPAASVFYAPVIITLSVIGIIYGALLAVGQTDLKRLIAYTSISHFGFIVLGIFAMTTLAQSGSTFYMLTHGFSTGALFLIVGFLMTRRGSRLVKDYGGVYRVAPVLAGLFLIAGLSSLALPGMASFISEFLVLVGTFEKYTVAAVIATTGIVFAALYILLMYQRTMTGPVIDSCKKMTDIKGREAIAVIPMLVLLVALGVYPKPALDVINPAVERVMVQVGVTDPVPELLPEDESSPETAESTGEGSTAP
jgi:NADH-quinone oxidoreductase subunit M